jgi:hypothetical protein
MKINLCLKAKHFTTPHQNFISKDFFVAVSEKHGRQSLLEIPGFVNIIKFKGEKQGASALIFFIRRPR